MQTVKAAAQQNRKSDARTTVPYNLSLSVDITMQRGLLAWSSQPTQGRGHLHLQATAQLFPLPLRLFSWGPFLALFNYTNINSPSRPLLATLHKILAKREISSSANFIPSMTARGNLVEWSLSFILFFCINESICERASLSALCRYCIATR